MKNSDVAVAARLLEVMERDILPLTEAGVARGNKLFGAAILRKSVLSLVIAGTNDETTNPLHHGEIAALNRFYAMPAATRPATGDCLFLSTHEPCSLSLSAITWAGFDNFHFFFGYEATRDAFNIPHDLRILSEVFKIENGDYARENAFWTSRSVVKMAGGDPALARRIEDLRHRYDALSATYQAGKADNDISLS